MRNNRTDWREASEVFYGLWGVHKTWECDALNIAVKMCIESYCMTAVLICSVQEGQRVAV